MIKHHSVIIVGAGPAGITASIELCRNRIPHILIEKGNFPKDKICGDALSGKVLEVLKKLDKGLHDRFILSEQEKMGSYGVKFFAPNGNALEVPFSNDLKKLHYAPGFISKRIQFDQWLFDQVDFNYCDYRQGTSLNSIARIDGRLALTCKAGDSEMIFSCDLVIGAEGDRSVVAKQLANFQKDNASYSAGLRCYFENVSGLHKEGFIELHFLKDLLPGYFWIFPLPDNQANVGLGLLSKDVSKRKLNLRKKLEEIIQTHPEISIRFIHAKALEEPKGWGLPLGSVQRKLSGQNYLLTGDAASLIDPFTGEGIGNAMLSGLMASQQAKMSLEANKFDVDFLQQYTEKVYQRLGSELRLSHKLQQLSGYEWLFNFVINKAAKNKTIQEVITSMFADIDVRAKFRDPKFYFKLLFS